MIRKFKLFGVLTGALALTAVAASAAQAAPDFHVESAPATITLAQVGLQQLTTNSGTLQCTSVTSRGSTSVTTTTTQALSPNYSGCSGFGGFLGTTVTTNGCDFLVHLVSGGVSPYPATTDIVCPAGKDFTYTTTFSNCVGRIVPQTSLTGAAIAIEGSKSMRQLSVSLNIAGIKYEQTGSNCFGGEGTFTNGTLTGEATVKADVDSTATQQGLWVA